MPSKINALHNRTGLIKNYRFFQYRVCPCTHYVFGVDYSGSMTGQMSTAHGALETLVGYLDSENQGSPFVYFFSYFYFNHIAEIPEYLHIKPFTPLPGPPGATGGTSFNNAIERGVEILNMWPGENMCFWLISDGGSWVSQSQIDKLNEAYDRARKYGCWTCLACFYIHVNDGEAQFKDLCDKIGAPFYRITPTNYRAVASKVFDQTVRRRAAQFQDGGK